ncbi:hypothetical protein [Paracoccus shanxieyensis]|uniref:Uncharacterized protein n=1 Tax=Paracoccus shanxieyensis TaxID=2675752 RepID=A0A6L6IWY5_9RHOB|nr:hypothetical protein [Paracoccus shanxieyensis]MTH65025.1 hypothetical protein [Paracoccus shanxieyensis]MTH88071.1 hypothetical protein [Paracoccus shanxieyensis]
MRDVLRYLNATPDGDPYGDELPIDRIVLTSFDLDMTAEEFLAAHATDLGDRVILRPGAGSDALVIWDVRIDDLADVLIL